MGVRSDKVFRYFLCQVPGSKRATGLADGEIDLSQVAAVIAITGPDEKGNDFALANTNGFGWHRGMTSSAEDSLPKNHFFPARVVNDKPLDTVTALRVSVFDRTGHLNESLEGTLPTSSDEVGRRGMDDH